MILEIQLHQFIFKFFVRIRHYFLSPTIDLMIQIQFFYILKNQVLCILLILLIYLKAIRKAVFDKKFYLIPQFLILPYLIACPNLRHAHAQELISIIDWLIQLHLSQNFRMKILYHIYLIALFSPNLYQVERYIPVSGFFSRRLYNL